MRKTAAAIAIVLVLTGCTDPSGAALIAPETSRRNAVEPETNVSHTSLAIAQAVYYPCGDALVDMTGHLSVAVRSRPLDADRYELRYTARMVNVVGKARTGDTAYRVAGAVTGLNVASHRDRAVSVADFTLLVTSPPDDEVGRADVAPTFRVLVAFPVTEEDGPDAPFIEDLFITQDCNG